MMKTSRYKGLVLGSFLARETDMIFGDELGSPLFNPLIANSVLVCVMLMRFYIGTAKLKKVLGWA